MIMDFHDKSPQIESWEKVTKKIVDSVTFSCTVNVAFVPRIEDCSYETTCFAICHPRFGEKINSKIDAEESLKPRKKDGNAMQDTTWTPMDFTTGAPITETSKLPAKVQPQEMPSSPLKSCARNKSAMKNSPIATKKASLGSFFSKSSVEKIQEMDNQSLGSRSMNSRSVTDRSHAERSKAEESLANKSKQRRSSSGNSVVSSNSKTSKIKRRGSKESLAMRSIDEMGIADFEARVKPENKKPTGTLGHFLQQEADSEDEDDDDDDDGVGDQRSVSGLSTSELSKNEKKLRDKVNDSSGDGLTSFLESGSQSPTEKEEEAMQEEKSLTLEDVGPIEKKLRFKEGHEAREIPRLTDSMYDDLFYMSEELADFRYAAFLEEAGLDVNEYM